MVQSGVHYGLRARAAYKPRRQQAALSSDDQHAPGAAAIVAAGFRPGVLTRPELLRFAGVQHDYLRARSIILERWDANVGQYLTLQTCIDAAGEVPEGVMGDAYSFLQQQGCINMGVPAGEPGQEKEPEEEPEASPTDDDIIRALQEILKKADLQETTERMVRKQVQGRLGVDVSHRKAFIKEQVTKFISGEMKSPSKKPAKQKPARVDGRVIIVGAGPAGLAAANHLKRCGVEAVVLEARERVGGRVHTYTGAGFSGPIDLGASLITGTATDVAKGLRADPSAVVARQLGISLHALDSALPLYDGLTGERVEEARDRELELVRDTLMDDARERVDELGEGATQKESLGAALDQAYAARFGGAASSGPALPENVDQSEAQLHELKQAAADQSCPGELMDTAKHASDNGQPDLALSDQSCDAQPPSLDGAATREPDQTAPTAEASVMAQHEAVAMSEDDAKETGASEESAQAADDQQGGAAAAAGVHAVPAEAAAAAASGSSAAAGAPSTGAGGAAPGLGEAAGAPLAGDDTANAVAPTSTEDAPASMSAPDEAADGDAVRTEPEQDLPKSLDELGRRILDWHWSHLEYGCSAPLHKVSLAHWNQDEEYGGFGGPHCMVVGGYGAILAGLAQKLDIRFNKAVTAISEKGDNVVVTTADGETLEGSAVIITLPLGCLKAGDVQFQPALPEWKTDAIARLGNGNLNKVIMEFPEAFWEASVDYFGAALPGGLAARGCCFMFWNLQRFAQKPILTAVVAGEAAEAAEKLSTEEAVAAAMEVLGRLFGNAIPQPTASLVTKWRSDEYARGSYSYVAVGSSAKTYDDLATPVRRRILFAGEHTCKEHPDTVGGAMLTGLREAIRVFHMLKGEDAFGKAAAALVDKDAVRKRKKGEAEEVELEDGGDLFEEEEPPARKQKRKAMAAKKRKTVEEEQEEEEELEPEEVAGLQKRQRRAAAKSPELPMTAAEHEAELRRREALRDQHKLIYRALYSAGEGDMVPVRELLASSSAELQSQLLGSIQKSDRKVLTRLAADVECLRALDLWMIDLIPDTRAFQILEDIIQVLKVLPVPKNLLEASRIKATVAERLPDHGKASTRALAKQLIDRWEPKPAQAGPTAQSWANSAPEAQPRASSATGSLPAPSSAAAVSEDDDETELMDEQLLMMLDRQKELEALAKAAEEDLAKGKAEGAVMPSIRAFEDFKKKMRRRGDSDMKRAEKLAQRRARAEKALQEAEAEGGKHSEHTNGHAKPGSSSGEAGHHSSNGRAHGKHTKLEEVVASFVNGFLTPLFKANKLAKEDFKWVSRKAVNKVLEGSRGKPADGFMSPEREAKIRKLVEGYIKARKRGAT